MSELDELAAAASSPHAPTYRRAARPRPAAGPPVWVWVAGGVAVLCFLCLIGVAMNGGKGGAGPAPAASYTPSLGRGDTGVLAHADGANVDIGVAPTVADFDRYTKLANARDGDGVGEMVLAGRLYVVSAGTPCKVIDPGIMQTEVRILGGPAAGRSGWVAAEMVRAAPVKGRPAAR